MPVSSSVPNEPSSAAPRKAKQKVTATIDVKLGLNGLRETPCTLYQGIFRSDLQCIENSYNPAISYLSAP